MQTDNFGFNVRIKFQQNSIYWSWTHQETTLHNVTEIHFNYDNGGHKYTNRVAFESNIHGTGNTYDISDILEFESILATELHKEF